MVAVALPAPRMRLGRHAVIGDGRSCALVDGAGTVDWLCWPRFDSDATFAALLDRERGGCFSIRPRHARRIAPRYVKDTNVVVTAFGDDAGAVELTDLMPVDEDGAHVERLAPEHELLRVLTCTRGEMTIDVRYDPRPGFAVRRPRIRRDRLRGVFVTAGAAVWSLRVSVPVDWHEDARGGVACTLHMRAGDQIAFDLVYAHDVPLVLRPLDDHGAALVSATCNYWRGWAKRARYEGPHRDLVVRSALVLKLLCYAPSGAIVAAPTTSLPEKRHGDHNWDYRFCWLRDAAFTARALFGLGYCDEGGAFCHWLLHATRRTKPRLKVLYDVFGKSPGRERILSHLSGWNGARPVRVANGAIDQLQLDVHGEVIDAVAQQWYQHLDPDPSETDLLRELGDYVAKNWQEPDEGIWEPRTGREHHVHSRLLEWVALDRVLGLADLGVLSLSVKRRARFEQVKSAIDRQIRIRGWNSRIGAYTSTLDGDELDATALLLSWYEFEDASSERMRSTARAIDRVLGLGKGLIRRNLALPDDGGFVACAFWFVEHLARGGGTLEEATERFDAIVEHAGELGLFSELVDPHGDALGNFPQGFSHLALVNAAMSIEHRMKEES